MVPCHQCDQSTYGVTNFKVDCDQSYIQDSVSATEDGKGKLIHGGIKDASLMRSHETWALKDEKEEGIQTKKRAGNV